MITDPELRGPDDPRLEERNEHGWLKYVVYACAQCDRQYLATRHGVPDRGWLLGQTQGKQQAWNGWFCSKHCVREWLFQREQDQTEEVTILAW